MDHVLCGLAANTALPRAFVDRLIAVADADVAWRLADRADLGHAQAVALFARVPECGVQLAYGGRLTAADVDPVARPDVALALLDEGGGSPHWASLLAADPDPARREKLAACPGLPADVVEILAADPEVCVVAELALWTTSEVIGGLARHPHADVRRSAAANDATPPDVLAALVTGRGLPPVLRCVVCEQEATPFVHDRQCARPGCVLPSGASCDGSHESAVHDIRQAALQNPATPAEAAAGFADHPSMLLRWALAARPDLPAAAYRKLAADPAPGVRADVAANPAIDDALMSALAADRDPDVRRGLAHNPRVPLDVLARLAESVRIGATLLPRIAAATPAEVLRLVRSPIPAVRMLLARRRDLPPQVRDRLADDPDAKVVRSVASHPGLTEARLRAMLDRHGVQVLAGVAVNPDASPELLEHLTRHDPPVPKALREIARHPNASPGALLACLKGSQARPIAAGRAELPPAVVVELLDDADPRVVEEAAANPSLPRAVIEDLIPRG
ncbi:hypothetical protein ABT330_27525 [Streptomyces sp. NPDC000658]|uniref:hypothetical protein n=1 Tax=Streptomyces sp. NPDC000658 TaxID=3154266 RepID=UPI0033282673